MTTLQYISTRGGDQPVGFGDALLSGLARDGGLYLPQQWPQFQKGELAAMAEMDYAEVAATIMAKFTAPDFDFDELLAICRDAYGRFSAHEVAPLRRINDRIHLCELFHGPTIAFKDHAMQVLSRLFDRALDRRGRKAVILGATSGDTGSAALEAFKHRDRVDTFILYPEGRVSPVQERQMTAIAAEGAHAIAVDGDFDDCQAIVKTLFGDLEFRDRIGLSAVNSINWARLIPQIVYYVTSALALGGLERPVCFAVPTGNFGNIFAGYAARRMGLPIKALICASNRNDILTRFFMTRVMERRPVEPSLSPSMDIQVSSNFERLLFELLDRDGERVCRIMEDFAGTGRFRLPDEGMTGDLESSLELFRAFRFDDSETIDEIRRCYHEDGILIDPHTAVGLSAARMVADDEHRVVALACAHPAKFPEAVEEATGIRPSLPAHLADLMDRPHHAERSPADASAVAALITRLMRR